MRDAKPPYSERATGRDPLILPPNLSENMQFFPCSLTLDYLVLPTRYHSKTSEGRVWRMLYNPRAKNGVRNNCTQQSSPGNTTRRVSAHLTKMLAALIKAQGHPFIISCSYHSH